MSHMKPQLLVQCDFDGTITHDDVSFLLLDEFADGDWREMLTDYSAGGINVAEFSTKAFGMIKADRRTLLNYMAGKVKIRAGFIELLAYCREKGVQFVIVSNGMDFYIHSILSDLGLNEIEVFAARTEFHPSGLKVRYIGPDDIQLQDGFKESYTKVFISQGYQVIYIGNGASDIFPAKEANHVFATSTLIKTCEQEGVHCVPFENLYDVTRRLEVLKEKLAD